jgi:hypothetical protein
MNVGLGIEKYAQTFGLQSQTSDASFIDSTRDLQSEGAGTNPASVVSNVSRSKKTKTS